jgi:hypothetical protein
MTSLFCLAAFSLWLYWQEMAAFSFKEGCRCFRWLSGRSTEDG